MKRVLDVKMVTSYEPDELEAEANELLPEYQPRGEIQVLHDGLLMMALVRYEPDNRRRHR